MGVRLATFGGHPLRGIPPRKLVISSLYRWVRNPMYLGLELIIAGEADHLFLT